MITKFKASNFTIFTDFEIDFSSGINIIIGENGTGKTHLMKAIYSASAIMSSKVDTPLDLKVKGIFMPNTIGRLVHRAQGRSKGGFTVYRRNESDGKERSISLTVTTLNKAEVKMSQWKGEDSEEATFIPVKDMLANAPGFRSVNSKRELTYEEIYTDIIDKALLPIAKGKLSADREKLLKHLQKAIDGKVINDNETFYLSNKSGKLEFPLLAEGFRKLGLLYRLIQNESLIHGSILFWDEPEANLNPKLSKEVVNILLELQRMGVQIFITTHDYVLLRELELATTDRDQIMYHVLTLDENKEVNHKSYKDLACGEQNAIDETFTSLLDRKIQKGIKELVSL